MLDHRAKIVKRVMRSLEETTDPDRLVAERVEAELVEMLRFPKGGAGGGLLPTLYVHRGAVAVASALVAATSALMAFLFLF